MCLGVTQCDCGRNDSIHTNGILSLEEWKERPGVVRGGGGRLMKAGDVTATCRILYCPH